MTTNLDRAQLVSRHVELVAIVLRSANVHSDAHPLSTTSELQLEQSFRARAEFGATPDTIDVFVDLSFAARNGGHNVVGLEATYLAVYRLTNAREYPSDAVGHFASLNGPYNVWPYWRELVQTVSGRVGIASILVPVFRPPVRQLSDDEQQQVELQLQGFAKSE